MELGWVGLAAECLEAWLGLVESGPFSWGGNEKQMWLRAGVQTHAAHGGQVTQRST